MRMPLEDTMPPMRRFAAILMLTLLASSCTIWKEKQPKTWQSATGPEAFEQLLWEDIQAGRWAEVERRLAPTFVTIGPQDRYDRAGAMEQLKKLQITQFALGEVDVRPNGETAVITYVISLNGTIGGEPLTGPIRRMSVWQKQGEAWLLIASTGMPAVATPAGTATPSGNQLPKM
jgi:hypothetical protein